MGSSTGGDTQTRGAILITLPEMASQRWDKGGNMFKKEDSASKLYRGIKIQDEKSAKLRAVVTRVMSLVWPELNAVLQHEGSSFYFGVDNMWKVTREQGSITLSYHAVPWSDRGEEIFVDKATRGFRQPPPFCVDDIHRDLSKFVDGMKLKFPYLERQLEPYFRAADE